MDTESNCLLCGKDYINCRCGIEITYISLNYPDDEDLAFLDSDDILLDMCSDPDDEC